MQKFDLSSNREKPQAADLSLLLGINPQNETIRLLPLGQLRAYPSQPFKPYNDLRLKELSEDIKANGVICPIIVRPLGMDSFEILAGHNRWNAARLAGLSAIPAIVKPCDDDTAALIMVNTNLNQREQLLPSERAFAYKIQLDSMKRKMGRPSKDNVSQLGTQKRSDQIMAEIVGESRNQIQRYIRLTCLIPELLELVDRGDLALVPAVSLSYLTPLQQELVLEASADLEGKISLKAAATLKELASSGELTITEACEILTPEKGYSPFNDFSQRIRRLIPKRATAKDIENLSCLIEEYFTGREAK